MKNLLEVLSTYLGRDPASVIMKLIGPNVDKPPLPYIDQLEHHEHIVYIGKRPHCAHIRNNNMGRLTFYDDLELEYIKDDEVFYCYERWDL
jgi:hypothetical protein